MELEKEVLELYKMLDYWKTEAKTQQEGQAEANMTLKNQNRAHRLFLGMHRVINKHS